MLSALKKHLLILSTVSFVPRKLESAVPAQAEQFERQAPVSTKPDLIKEQMLENEAIASELEQCRNDVQDLEDCGKWLVENLPSDPGVIQEVHERIAKAREPVDKLSAKVSQRQNQLETAALQAQQFADYFDEFSLKIAKLEDELASLLPVSGVYSTCSEQLEEVERIERVISQQEAMVEKVKMVGQKVLDNLPDGPDKKEIAGKLRDLEKRWDDLNSKVAKRKNLIESVLPVSKDLDRDSGNFSEWLTNTESRVKDFTLESLDADNIEQKINAFKGVVDEIRAKKVVLDNLEEKCKNVTDICEADEEIIESQTAGQRKRYEALKTTAKEKQDNLTEVKHLVEEYNNCAASLDHVLDETEATLKAECCVGIDRHEVLTFLEGTERLMERLADSEEELEKMRSFSSTILTHVDKNSPSAKMLETRVKNATERYYVDKDQLVEYFISKQNDVLTIVKLWMIYETIEEGLPTLVDEVEALSPVSAKPSVVAIQMQETEALLEDAERYKEKIEAVEEFAEDAQNINNNSPEVVKFVQDKISDVRVPLDRVTRKLEDRLKKLQAASIKGKDYEDLLQQLQDKLSTLEVGVTATQPVSGVYGKTKEQKDDADRVTNSLKQQEPVYEKIMEIGQALLESSPDETDGESLKEDLNDLTSKWQDVTNKANEREESLKDALPLTKSYSTAHDDFCNWLSETERKLGSIDEMPLDVENIEKIEQRLTELAEDVDAHEGVYDEYVVMAAKVVDLCEDVVVIETEAKTVERRWNELKNKVAAKKADAERVKEVLMKHHKALEDIEDVNDKMGNIVNSKDLYNLDNDKLKETLEKAKV